MNKEPAYCKYCIYRREPFYYHMERVELKNSKQKCSHFLLSFKKLNQLQLEVLKLYTENHKSDELKDLEFNFTVNVLL
jgi:hypothetical protein